MSIFVSVNVIAAYMSIKMSLRTLILVRNWHIYEHILESLLYWYDLLFTPCDMWCLKGIEDSLKLGKMHDISKISSLRSVALVQEGLLGALVGQHALLHPKHCIYILRKFLAIFNVLQWLWYFLKRQYVMLFKTPWDMTTTISFLFDGACDMWCEDQVVLVQ